MSNQNENSVNQFNANAHLAKPSEVKVVQQMQEEYAREAELLKQMLNKKQKKNRV